MTTSAPSDLLPRLAAIVGPAHLLTDPADLAPYLREPRERYRGRARCVVRPKTRDEVAAILALCHAPQIASSTTRQRARRSTACSIRGRSV